MIFNAEMLGRLKILTKENNEELLKIFLDMAGNAIVEKAYPFSAEGKRVPAKYQNKQIEIALYLYNKQGAEGETAHNENGISRSYENAGIPDSMLKGIVPFASIPGGERNEMS